MTKLDELQAVAVKQQLDALTGLRIVAAMWVFLHHFSDVIFGLLPALRFLEPLFNRGGVGVDLFFMLSGFILAYTYLARLGSGLTSSSYLGFLRLRIARVYPVHLATLLSSFILVVGASVLGAQVGGTVHTPWALVQNLLLVQAWFNQPYSWNGVAWSVSAEWFVYLAFPLVAALILKVRSGLLLWVGVGVPLALYVFMAHFLLAGASEGGPDNVLLRVSASFVAGCFLYRIYEKIQVRSHLWRWLAPAAGLSIVVSAYVLPVSGNALLLPPLCFLILGLAKGIDPISRILSTRAFVFGGSISYSFYMVHAQVISVVRAVIPASVPWFVGIAIILASLGIVLVAAWLLYRFIEEPSRRFLRGKGSRRRPVETS